MHVAQTAVAPVATMSSGDGSEPNHGGFTLVVKTQHGRAAAARRATDPMGAAHPTAERAEATELTAMNARPPMLAGTGRPNEAERMGC